MIVGCFGNQKNSSRLIKNLNKKGYKAYKLDVHKNLHRVALATYDLKEDAILAQLEIKKVELEEIPKLKRVKLFLKEM